jgi:hypothetical protein
MPLVQRVRRAIVQARTVGPQMGNRAFGTIAVLALAQVLAGPLWAQEQDSKKVLDNGWSMKSLQNTSRT